MLLHAGLADAAICGGSANWWRQVRYVLPIIPRRPGVSRAYGLGCLILQHATLFICDTQMVVDPTAEQIAEMTVLAAEAVSEFGIAPKVALLSHSNFGASDFESARKMRNALALLRERAPELEVDGEMHADAALVAAIRDRAVPDSRLSGTANLLVMPTLDAANIAFTLLKAAVDGLPVGPHAAGDVEADPCPGPERHRPRHRQPERVRGAAVAVSGQRRMIGSRSAPVLMTDH